jgi:hypothetical protein
MLINGVSGPVARRTAEFLAGEGRASAAHSRKFCTVTALFTVPNERADRARKMSLDVRGHRHSKDLIRSQRTDQVRQGPRASDISADPASVCSNSPHGSPKMHENAVT